MGSVNILSRLAVDPCDILTIKCVFVRFTVYHSIRSDDSKYIPALPNHWGTVVLNSITTAASKFEALLGDARLVA